MTVSSASITAGTKYWIAVMGTGGYLNYRDTNNGAVAWASTTNQGNLTAMPATFPNVASYDSGPASAYLNGTSTPPPPVAPSDTTAPSISGTAQQGDTLTASPGTWTGTAPISYTYQWSDGTTGSTDTLSAADVGQNITVTVTASNSAGSAEAVSNSVGPVAPIPTPVPPSNTTAPSISGTAQQGDTLTADPGTWTGDTPITYTYAWSDGSTGKTDTLGLSDIGQNVSVTVTATNDAGSATATSASVGPVTAAPQPPDNTGLPTITGTPQVGDTLTASDGSWSGDTPMSFSIVWSDGTTGPTDTLTSADVGDNITATVTASNDAGSASATSASVGPVTPASGPPPPPPGCTTTLTAGSSIVNAVNAASSGNTICLDAGTYSGGTINGDKFSSFVTVEPVTSTTDVTVDSGFTIDNSSYIDLQGLDIEGGGIGGDGGVAYLGTSGSNYELNDDTIANSDYGVIIGSSSGAISNVLITHSLLHNFDFSGSSAGTGGGQAVSCYWCGTGITISHDIFYAASWHYIQCGGCSDMTVDHNLFTCPCNQHSGAHLNVFQIWQGGSDDSFTNNIVDGTPGADNGSGEICGGCVLFENGPGGGTASDGFTNYDVSNNLFVNSGGSLPIQVQTTTGGTVSNNTVADGFQYGLAIGYNGVTNVESTDLVSQYNIVAGQFGNGQAYGYGCSGSGCVSDYNVADSHGGTSGTGSINGWTEDWDTTTWNDPLTTPMPAGFYVPADLASTYGYQAPIGP